MSYMYCQLFSRVQVREATPSPSVGYPTEGIEKGGIHW